MRKISKAAYARHRGVSGAAVTKAIQRGRISVDQNGKIDPEIADREWMENSNPIQVYAQNHRIEETPEIKESKARLAFAHARLAELKYKKKIGELIPREQVEKEAFETGRLFRDNILLIPHAISYELAQETNPRKCEVIIRNKIEETLELIIQ